MNAVGNRKVIGAIVTTVIGVVITQVKGDIPPNLLSLLIAVFSGFVLGNIGEHVTAAISGRSTVETAEEPVEIIHNGVDNTELARLVGEDMTNLNIKLDTIAEGVQATNQALTGIITKYKMNE